MAHDDVLPDTCSSAILESATTKASKEQGSWLRRDPTGEVFVIAGPPRAEDATKERYVAALRRGSGKRIQLTSRWAPVWFGWLAIMTSVMCSGLWVGYRRLQRARASAESVRRAYSAVASDPPTYRRPASLAEPASVEACLEEGSRSAKKALAAALGFGAAILLTTVVFGGVFVFYEFYRLFL
jgi:hypothetical protein